MFSFLKRSEPSLGLVFFRGTAAHRPEEYQFLTKLGVSGKLRKPEDGAYWQLDLEHKKWGSATMVALRDPPMPPKMILDFSAGLSEEDREEMAGAGWAVAITVPASRGHILRDRKNLLRYLRAVMGDDGIAALDNQSQLFWTRGALDDELQHDADLDVDGIYCFHAVTDDRGDDDESPIPWVHTHGLGELGAYDFDILDCHPDLASGTGADGLRAVAFAVLEGVVKPGAEFPLKFPGKSIRAVDAAEFQARASPAWLAKRGDDGTHQSRRVVLCESGAGFLGRLFGKGGPTPYKGFMESPEGCVFHMSDAATELSAERARLTLSLFGRFKEEFAEFEPMTLAKIGCKTSTGGREHPWFVIETVAGEALTGTCANDPIDIPGLKNGDRVTKPVADLTDWVVMLPMGTLNPRSMRVARFIRSHLPEMREIMAQARREADAEERAR
jgi:hypothetical protein